MITLCILDKQNRVLKYNLSELGRANARNVCLRKNLYGDGQCAKS